MNIKKFLKKHWLLIISFIYILWPLDLISEMFGPVGLIDDASVLTVAVAKEIFNYKKQKDLEKNSLQINPNSEKVSN